MWPRWFVTSGGSVTRRDTLKEPRRTTRRDDFPVMSPEWGAFGPTLSNRQLNRCPEIRPCSQPRASYATPSYPPEHHGGNESFALTATTGPPARPQPLQEGAGRYRFPSRRAARPTGHKVRPDRKGHGAAKNCDSRPMVECRNGCPRGGSDLSGQQQLGT